jgi:hypothetical protein
MSSGRERRRYDRNDADKSKLILVFVEEPDKDGEYVEAIPIDYSASGMKLETATPLTVDSFVVLRTYFPAARELGQGHVVAKVVWCTKHQDERYRAGVAFKVPMIEPSESKPAKSPEQSPSPALK